jgi:DNA polymerase-1
LTASLIYNKDIGDVTGKERFHGKTVNFSSIYGSTPYGLASKNPDISLDDAEKFLSELWSINGYPTLKAFIDNAGEIIWRSKISKTPLGRVRRFPKQEVFDEAWQYKSYKKRTKREGVNHIIQGGSADALKIAMCDIFYNNPFGMDNFKMVLQVHDELVIEVKNEYAKEAQEFVETIMNKSEQQFLGEISAETDSVISTKWSK